MQKMRDLPIIKRISLHYLLSKNKLMTHDYKIKLLNTSVGMLSP